MRLDRYILGQVLWPVLGALLALNGLFLVIQILKVGEVTFSAGLSMTDLLEMGAYFLPGFAVLTVPVAVLTGVLLGFGRLGDDGELVAMAAAGVSPLRLARMPLLLGLLASTFAFCLAGWVAPASARALHSTFVDLARRHVVASLAPGRFFEEVPRVVFYPHQAGPAPNTFDGFMLYDHRPDRVRHAILASQATVVPDESGHRLTLELTDGEVHARNKKRDTYSVARFERASIAVDIDRLIRDRTRFLAPQERLSFAELSVPGTDDRDSARRLAAYHRRIAFPAACLVFGLLGTALGASGRLRGRKRTLLAAGVVVTGYYLLMRFADALVDQGQLPPVLAAWMPNLLFVCGLGFWLVRRGRRPG
jgi:lipopolysaccharide export system permease protein